MCVEDLTDLDYQIMDFINQKKSVEIAALQNRFQAIDSLEYRINMLATTERYHSNYGISLPVTDTHFIQQDYENIKGSNGITSTRYLDTYYLTDLGKKALQDYKVKTKRENKDLWLKSVWIPIIVSLITTIATMCITWMLSRILK